MNRIINDYGALNITTGAGVATQNLMDSLAVSMRAIVERHALSPEEIICLERKLANLVSGVGCESVLRKAMNMRKAERATEKKQASNLSHISEIVPLKDGTLAVTQHPAKRRVPLFWCRRFGVEVIDPDGWDRTNPSWMMVPITQDQFIDKFQRSTTRVVDRVRYNVYKHLFQ